MEAITRIVSESLARHGFDRPLDYRRLHWSRWFRCESHHSLLIVPSKPGVCALAEEIADFNPAATDAESKKPEAGVPHMLAVTEFLATDDMAFVLDRMLSSRNPMQDRLLSGRYFVRFVVIEDEVHRRSVCSALNQWVAGSGEKASGIGASRDRSCRSVDRDRRALLRAAQRRRVVPKQLAITAAPGRRRNMVAFHRGGSLNTARKPPMMGTV